MKQDIKISIIIPVYNTEQYLQECLNSVIAQSLKEIEIIVINDGSPDHSIQIIREYEKKDPRIVVIDKKNEGVGKARNDGLHKASGEYVAFMDSDDFYPNDGVLEMLYSLAQKHHVKICGGTYERERSTGREARTDSFEEYGYEFEKYGLLKYSDYQYDFGYTTYIYERKMLMENGIEFPMYSRFQDPPFFVKAMITAGTCYRTNQCVYVYREIVSTAKASPKKVLDAIQGMKDNLAISRDNQLSKLYYLTACRLKTEISYLILLNRKDNFCDEVLFSYIRALSAIDVEYLKAEGLELDNTLPEVFSYMRDCTMKYEKIVNNGIVKIIKRVKKRMRR